MNVWVVTYCVAVTLLLCLVLAFLVLYPVKKVGKKDYCYYMSKINPFVRRILDKYLVNKEKKLSAQWLNNFELVAPVAFPNGYWIEDQNTSKGIDSFYLRDQYSEDARNLLGSSYKLPCDQDAILKARIKGNYFFLPEASPEAKYHIANDLNRGGYLDITTADDLDTWVYLPAKEKQPSVYAVDFDLITFTETKETLQIDFMMSTLAERYRFVLKDNRVLKFDIWYSGFSLGYTEEWKKFEKPFSIPLGEIVHVRLEVLDNIYQISFNGKPEMTIRAKEYRKEPSYWSLIFWNGTKENKNIHMCISDFKILHRSLHCFNN